MKTVVFLASVNLTEKQAVRFEKDGFKAVLPDTVFARFMDRPVVLSGGFPLWRSSSHIQDFVSKICGATVRGGFLNKKVDKG